ncbi:MAG: GNAT family N-acetyltransferase [Streptosporangiaceae bacterium]
MNRTAAANRTTAALLRQAGPDDCPAIRDFVCGLSPRSQYLRFFAAVAPPSTGLLRALCGTTSGADVLLATDRSGIVIGHGMAADALAGGSIETSIGLVVADAWQRRGLGTLVLSTLVGRAARRGVSSLVLEVLPDNRVMLGIIGRRWPDAQRERTPDAIVIRPSITPAAAHWPVPRVVQVVPYDRPAPRRSAA